MLQPLLAERFHLKLQRETQIHELAVAKGGVRLKERKCVGTPSQANPCGVFTALQEQLELKMGSAKGLIEVLLTASAEQSAQN